MIYAQNCNLKHIVYVGGILDTNLSVKMTIEVTIENFTRSIEIKSGYVIVF